MLQLSQGTYSSKVTRIWIHRQLYCFDTVVAGNSFLVPEQQPSVCTPAGRTEAFLAEEVA